MLNKSSIPTKSELDSSRKWHYVDASSQPLGRVATKIATLLMGKHKRIYTPHIDCGDFVVVTNASKLYVTGRKEETKFYFHHTGYVNGAKVVPFKRQMENDPTKVVMLAVKRMLDDNRLRSPRLRRLKIFAGETHTYPVAKTDKAPKATAKAA